MEERKEKFPPGPWYIKPREAYETCLGTAYSRTTILDKPDGQYSPRHVIATVARGNGREEANAALIAAAPEMYGALTRIVEMQRRNYGHGSDTHIELIKLAKEAEEVLKEARGEE